MARILTAPGAGARLGAPTHSREAHTTMTGEPPSPAQLAAITDAFTRELASLGRVRAYPKNTVFITEGDSSDSVFVILSGRVKAFVSDSEGHELTLNTQGPGDYVGEMALDGKPRSASVVTLEPSTFSVVQRAPLRDAIRQNPDFALDMIAKVIERAREATDNVKNLALLDVYGRVARLLLSLAVEAPDGKLRIPEKITQQDIAERVGASRDMVSRIFRDLTVGGYITVENRIITINKKPPARW
jgi:CRP/FNR family transcriptional regulator, cyclic AMP receptor protein